MDSSKTTQINVFITRLPVPAARPFVVWRFDSWTRRRNSECRQAALCSQCGSLNAPLGSSRAAIVL